MVIDAKLSQTVKALAPIVATELGMITDA